MPRPFSTPELREHLRQRVLGPEGQNNRRAFFFEEVELSGRRADAVSIGTWRSRGQLIEGYELKTNRRDWQNEMRQHEKAEPTLTICDRFWLVTNPDVLLPGELPEPWGLLLADGRGKPLKVEKPAPALRDRKSLPVTREALVRLLRCAEKLGTDERDDVYEQARREAVESVGFDEKRMQRELDIAQQNVRDYEAGWDAFHRVLGLERWKWQPSAEDLAFIGQIAAALRDGKEGIETLHRRLREIETTAGELVGKTNDAMQVVNDHLFGKGQAG